MAESNENGAAGVPPPKRRGGRPRKKWQAPDLREVENMASRGLTAAQIAGSLGIARSTLFLRAREYSDFSDSIHRGWAKGVTLMANVIFEAARGLLSYPDDTKVKIRPELRFSGFESHRPRPKTISQRPN